MKKPQCKNIADNVELNGSKTDVHFEKLLSVASDYSGTLVKMTLMSWNLLMKIHDAFYIYKYLQYAAQIGLLNRSKQAAGQ